MNKKIYFLFFLLFAPSMCFGEAKFSLEFGELPQNVDIKVYKTLFEKWEKKFKVLKEDKIIPLAKILKLETPYTYKSKKYRRNRNFWHKKLQYTWITKLIDYLINNKEEIETLKPKTVKKILARFKKDSIKKRKATLARKTNFRKKWLEKYKKVLEKQGMRIDKIKKEKTKAKLIIKFKKTLRNAEVQFKKRYAETQKAFKYAYDRAVKNLAKLIKKKAPKVKDSDAPVPPPIEGLDKKRKKKKKVKKEEDVPVAPPIDDLGKKKPRVKKEQIKEKVPTGPSVMDELKRMLQKRRESTKFGQEDIKEKVSEEPESDEQEEKQERKRVKKEIMAEEKEEDERIIEDVPAAPPVPEFEAKSKQVETKPLSPEELQAAKKKLKKTPAKKKTKKKQSELAKRIAEQKKQILEEEESKSEDDDDWYEGD